MMLGRWHSKHELTRSFQGASITLFCLTGWELMFSSCRRSLVKETCFGLLWKWKQDTIFHSLIQLGDWFNLWLKIYTPHLSQEPYRRKGPNTVISTSSRRLWVHDLLLAHFPDRSSSRDVPRKADTWDRVYLSACLGICYQWTEGKIGYH